MIEHYEFGLFVIDGKTYKSNIVLLGSEVKEARYLPGHELNLDDILLLVDYKPDVIIIGTGSSGVMGVPKEISEYIKKKGIKFIVEKTGKACQIYNALLKEGKRVAAFLHNTC